MKALKLEEAQEIAGEALRSHTNLKSKYLKVKTKGLIDHIAKCRMLESDLAEALFLYYHLSIAERIELVKEFKAYSKVNK